MKLEVRSNFELRRRRGRSSGHGMIFITALLTIIIMMGLLLAFTQEMSSEVTAAGNRVSQAQADAIELGAEQYVLAAIEANPGDALTTTSFPAEAVPMGSGYFWLLSPDPGSDQDYGFGIQDESAKVNLNRISSPGLQALGLSEELADPIYDWRGGTPQPEGAQSEYYNGLPEAYDMKGSPFESVEEISLVKNETGQSWNQILFGLDANRDGVVDSAERNTGNGPTINYSSVGGDDRGVFNDLTVWSVDPGTTITGTSRRDPNNFFTVTRITKGLQKGQLSVTPKPNLGPFLSNYNLTGDETSIVSGVQNYLTSIKYPGTGIFFKSIYEFWFATTVGRATGTGASGSSSSSGGGATASSNNSISEADFDTIADGLEMTQRTSGMYAENPTGLINVNTASQEVLYTLPARITNGSVTTADMDALIAARPSANLSGVAWVFDTLQQGNTPSLKCISLSRYITARSFQYSADIVAVSGDGKAFKRVRIVVDSTNIPASIVYRRDLTSYGWPLPPEIRQALQTGKTLPEDNQNSVLAAN